MNHDTVLFKKTRKLAFAMWKKYPALRYWRFKYWDLEEKKYRKRVASVAVNSHTVLFDSFGGRQYSDSPRAIYEVMLADERFASWNFYWSFKRPRVELVADKPELQRAKIIVRGSKEYFDICAQTKYFITNNRLMEYIVPKDDQVYIQCWHGTPLKKLGADNVDPGKSAALNSAEQLAERFKRDAQKWSYLVSPCKFTSESLCSAFSVPKERYNEVVCEVGYPRNDFIHQTLEASDAKQRVAEIKKQLGIPENKKVLLFAPTWRDDQYKPGEGYVIDLLIDIDLLQRELGNDWILLLRLHYYVARNIDITKWDGFAYDVSGVEDINHLYVVSDVLCTDYSSVFFDYANTRRPLVFYWPDRQHYESDLHGFYFNPDTIPGPKCETPQEVCAAIKDISNWDKVYGKDYQQFIETFCPHDDGNAAKRVIEHAIV